MKSDSGVCRNSYLVFALEIVVHLHTHREYKSVLVGWRFYLKPVVFTIDMHTMFRPPLNC